MGKKKWCFGREDVICMTKDCPYMSDCIQVVWEKKMERFIMVVGMTMKVCMKMRFHLMRSNWIVIV